MKKVLLILSIILLFLIFLGAYLRKNDVKHDFAKELQEKNTADSLKAFHSIDSINTINKSCPIVIKSAYFKKREYSIYQNVVINYKNVGDKPVKAIKFEYHGQTVFGDPADIGSNGIGSGFTDEIIKPGHSSTGVWNTLCSNGDTITFVRAYEVLYADKSKWRAL
jgi:hypothetical protein